MRSNNCNALSQHLGRIGIAIRMRTNRASEVASRDIGKTTLMTNSSLVSFDLAIDMVEVKVESPTMSSLTRFHGMLTGSAQAGVDVMLVVLARVFFKFLLSARKGVICRQDTKFSTIVCAAAAGYASSYCFGHA